MADTLLEVRDLRTYIYTRRGVVKTAQTATTIAAQMQSRTRALSARKLPMPFTPLL